jgi:adenylosuccinate lyase
MAQATADVAFGKISGPVGNHSTVPPEIESHVIEALGLTSEPAATQVVGRDRHATFVTTLAVIGSTVERLATEIRHLQRSEIAEVAEPFAESQKGSSAMPHKHNPILSENVTGLARLIRGYASAALENVALWHERDISHSSVERIILPDACLALDFALARMTGVISGLVVDVDRMAANLEATGGTVFSQAVLLALVEHGMSRDDAYRAVQQASIRAQSDGIHLREALATIEMPEGFDLGSAFDITRLLAHAGDGVDRLAQLSPESLPSAPCV